MTQAQWESLCDGCGRCCVHKVQDERSGETFYTDVACRLLDTHACRCTRYADRQRLVADCVRVTSGELTKLDWMPESCAYRLLHAGKPLPDWHPLVSKRPDSVHEAGMSVRGKVVPEQRIDVREIEHRLVDWRAGKSR